MSSIFRFINKDGSTFSQELISDEVEVCYCPVPPTPEELANSSKPFFPRVDVYRRDVIQIPNTARMAVVYRQV